jgi:hypothetical protein
MRFIVIYRGFGIDTLLGTEQRPFACAANYSEQVLAQMGRNLTKQGVKIQLRASRAEFIRCWHVVAEKGDFRHGSRRKDHRH